MCQAIRRQGMSLRDVLPPSDVLQLIMFHPLRVQVILSSKSLIIHASMNRTQQAQSRARTLASRSKHGFSL